MALPEDGAGRLSSEVALDMVEEGRDRLVGVGDEDVRLVDQGRGAGVKARSG